MDGVRVHRLGYLGLVFAASPAQAHGWHAAADGERLFEGLLVAILLVGALGYLRGLTRLWKKAGVGRGVRTAEAACFVVGWSALAASLLGPLDQMADRSFALHMTQHETLMVLAAPLIVLGRPLEVWNWGFVSAARRFMVRMQRSATLRRLFAWTVTSLGAWSLHATALWVWHIPFLFNTALEHPLLHILQHACFFGTALAYWWSVVGGRTRTPTATSIASLFTTMLHTSALGALLTFAPSPWYTTGGAGAFGLSALEDQQLGGLIMWVPGGLAYMVVGLAIIGRWLKRSQTPVFL
jgi:putative membrane protein